MYKTSAPHPPVRTNLRPINPSRIYGKKPFFRIFWTVDIAFIYLATRTGWVLILGNTIYVAFLVGMTYAHTIHDDALLFAFATPFTLLIFATLILPVAVGGGGIYRLHWLELHRTSTDPQGLHLGDY